MEKEVNKILERLSMEVISLDEARAEMRILGLFSVSQQRELLIAFEEWKQLSTGKNAYVVDRFLKKHNGN